MLKIALRVGIGLAVIGVLVVRLPAKDRHALVHNLRSAHPQWVALGALSLFAGLIVSSLRWRAYLDALELRMSLPTVLRLYFVGTFFNAFLPSGIGGDAYKAVRIGKGRGTLTEAFASVFLDRFSGFVALAGIGLIGSAGVLIAGERHRVVALIAAIASAGMIGAAVLLLTAGERLLGRGRFIKEEGIGGKLRGAVRAIHQAGRHPAAATRGYVYGVIFQLFVLGYHLALAKALGMHGISLIAMTGVVVVGSLATLVPLSPGGLGFRDIAYRAALVTFGVAKSQGIAFALLVDGILLLTSAAGFVVYVVAGGDVAATPRRVPT